MGCYEGNRPDVGQQPSRDNTGQIVWFLVLCDDGRRLTRLENAAKPGTSDGGFQGCATGDQGTAKFTVFE